MGHRYWGDEGMGHGLFEAQVKRWACVELAWGLQWGKEGGWAGWHANRAKDKSQNHVHEPVNADSIWKTPVSGELRAFWEADLK